MTVPTSGPIRLRADIGAEFGYSGSNMGLHAAEIGTYGSINGYSGSQPSNTSINTMGEWRGYDHSATGGGPTLYTHSLRYDGSSKANACMSSPVTYYSDCFSLINGCYLYSDSGGVTAAFAGWYATGSLSGDTVYASDGAQISSTTTCGA